MSLTIDILNYAMAAVAVGVFVEMVRTTVVDEIRDWRERQEKD